ncbi:hypothetical protein TRAPUB_5617 [Trametes pubescens]|uniref:Uncharacterized protein n=1 Tax=Trametes pubescens TaxID=154538 RepID=A0A1M2V894_TRAPU|nr:hypothetical protein TRAPUB_5617 [Trametes pubescens]
MINTILAKERASTPINTPTHSEKRVVYYDIPIRPRVPLHVGQEVEVMTLKSCQSLFPEDEGHHAPPRYTAHSAGIVGTVIAMAAIDEANTEIVVRNESPWSEVTHAYLAIQHVQDVTVYLSLWQRLLRATILRPIARIREVPLEADAVVYESKNRITRRSEDHPARIEQRSMYVEPTHGPVKQLGRRGGRRTVDRAGRAGSGEDSE